jgi:hypothetical protein
LNRNDAFAIDRFLFFTDNVAINTVLLFASGKINPSAAYLSAEDCFLLPPGEGSFESLLAAEKRNGVYLTWDPIRRRWNRAGKCNRKDGCGGRVHEHHEDSKNPESRHQLHLLFPDESIYQKGGIAIGTHQQLKWFLGLVFDSTNRAAMNVLIKKGLFVWSRRTMAMASRATIAGAPSTADKQLHLVAYSLELIFDTLLARAHNVSQSPGFEAFIGQFGAE